MFALLYVLLSVCRWLVDNKVVNYSPSSCKLQYYNRQAFCEKRRDWLRDIFNSFETTDEQIKSCLNRIKVTNIKLIDI